MGEYEVREDSPSTPASPWSEPQSFGVYCVVCHTLMQATEEQVGKDLICPDCGTATPVRPRTPHPRPRAAESGKPREEYVLGPDRGPPMPESRWFAWRPSRGCAASNVIVPPAAPPPPRWPMLSGVFSFPWYRECWPRWLTLSVWGGAAGYLGYSALLLSNSVAGGLGSLGPGIFALLSSAVAACMAFAWLAMTSIDGLTILTVTAAGNDRIEQWPDLSLFIDWIADVFFVVNSVALSVSAGWGLRWLLDLLAWPSGFAMPVVVVVLFPFFLMSMLETNSRVLPFSPAVFRSLFRHKLAWIVVLWGDGPGGGGGGRRRGRPPCNGPVSAWRFRPARRYSAAALMIYFRLLGRLGWCCTVGSPAPEDV